MSIFLMAAFFYWAKPSETRSPEVGLSFSPYMRLNYDRVWSYYHDPRWLVHAIGRLPIVSVIWFPGRLVALGPELSIIHINNVQKSRAVNAFFVRGRCALFFMNLDARMEPYVLGHAGVLGTEWDLDNDYDFTAGPGLGYS